MHLRLPWLLTTVVGSNARTDCMRPGRQFWADFGACLAWRLSVVLLFGALGYFGGGGDGIVYHVLGMHAREIVLGIPGPPLPELMLEWPASLEDLTAKYSGVLAELQKPGVGPFSSDTLPIILLHALVYGILPHPLAFTVPVAFLLAYANAKLIQKTGGSGVARLLIIFNPLSAYFAATHLKEGLAEVLLIGLVIAAWVDRRQIISLALVLLTLAFRPAYLPICVVILLAPRLSRVDPRILVFTAIVVVLLIPGVQWALPQDDGGFIFSVVHMNELTRTWLGLLVGFGAPYPVPVGPLSPFVIAMLLGGVLYWIVLPRTLLSFAADSYCTPFIWVPILLSALIGYAVEGDLATKTRFFAPIVPLLLVGWAFALKPRAKGVRGLMPVKE